MDTINFTNYRVFVKKKMNLAVKVIINLSAGIIYLFGVFALSAVGFDFSILSILIFCTCFLIWIYNRGTYVTSTCNISFFEDRLIIEYPNLDTGKDDEKSHVTYTLPTALIDGVILNDNNGYADIYCIPIKTIEINGIKTVVDNTKNNKDEVLTLNYGKVPQMQELMQKYLGAKVKIEE